MQSRMRNGAVLRTARRGAAVAVLGWVAALGASLLSAPTAEAAPSADVAIRDLTPPLVSVDPGGTVNFSDEIADKTVQVGGGGLVPSVVTVVVHTDVLLTLPSGNHPLQPGQQVSEKFANACLVGCAITYTYRAQVPDASVLGSVLTTVTGKALATLPQNQTVTYNGKQTVVTLGVPTPFLVNTVVPLPNLPSVNVPRLPAITVPTPKAPPVPVPVPPSAGQPASGGPVAAPAPAVPSIGGPAYSYHAGGAAQLAPAGAAGTPFDPSRRAAPGRGSAGTPDPGTPDTGSGGVAGGQNGAPAPAFGRPAGLDGPLGSDVAVASDAAALPAAQLSVPGLLAVIALAGSSTALVRARRAQRKA